MKAFKKYLTGLGHECLDFGPKEYNSDDDYPDFIRPAAEAVSKGDAQAGIILGGSGQGEGMVANRVPGIRCAVYYGPAKPLGEIEVEGTGASDEFEILRLSRKHNNANMLSLAARFLSEPDIEKSVKIWLDTFYEGVERHARRIAKIDGGISASL